MASVLKFSCIRSGQDGDPTATDDAIEFLKTVLAKGPLPGVRLSEHIEGDGQIIFPASWVLRASCRSAATCLTAAVA